MLPGAAPAKALLVLCALSQNECNQRASLHYAGTLKKGKAVRQVSNPTLLTHSATHAGGKACLAGCCWQECSLVLLCRRLLVACRPAAAASSSYHVPCPRPAAGQRSAAQVGRSDAAPAGPHQVAPGVGGIRASGLHRVCTLLVVPRNNAAPAACRMPSPNRHTFPCLSHCAAGPCRSRRRSACCAAPSRFRARAC